MGKDFLKGGFMEMLYSILGIVLLSALFGTVMSALAALYSTPGSNVFIAFRTIITIVPTVLLLGSTVGLGIVYVKGYQKLSSGGEDPSGLLRMVVGILEIVLFITMFASVITNFYTLYTTYGTNTTWIAFGTVITIVPTILFLGGIFSGGMVAVQGAKAKFGGKGKQGKAEGAA
jgi:hypothetical protein